MRDQTLSGMSSASQIAAVSEDGVKLLRTLHVLTRWSPIVMLPSSVTT